MEMEALLAGHLRWAYALLGLVVVEVPLGSCSWRCRLGQVPASTLTETERIQEEELIAPLAYLMPWIEESLGHDREGEVDGDVLLYEEG